MISCDWKAQGCTRMFKAIYAMRVHQRTCMFQNQPLLKKKRRNSQGYSIGAERVSRFRLRCDEETFPSRDFEESFIEPEPIEREDYETGNVIEELEKEEARYLKCFDKDEALVSSAMIKMARLSRKAGRGTVDEIIKMLISPEFPMEQLKSKCRSLADCLMKEDSVFKATFFDRGFQKVIVRDEENLVQCDLYLKSPIRVLSDQISGASKYACLFNTKSSYDQTESYAHPMDSQLGIRGERAIMNAIMSSKEDGVIWHNQEHSMETSFAGMIQLYSDKSSTTLKQSSFQFYPMHATMLNFSEQYRRHCIVHGMSVVAFLPVKFFSNENGNLIEKNLSRAHYLSMLRRCMELVLRELKEVGFPGFQCRDLEGTPRICHPVIASYCCDLPECHDILPIKNGNSSKRNCHRCNAFTQEFNTYTNHEKRTGVRTISILQSLRKLRNAGKNKDCEELMNEHSLIDFIPFLATFPFIGIDPVLDFHIIFSFEPLHNLHLGISRLLKSCLSERLRSMSAQSSRNAGNERIVPLRFSRLKILMGINRFLSHVQRYSPMNGARVDFSKGGSSGSEKGLYGPDGKLIGMLEGKDLRNVDMIFPFVGALLDRTCNEVESALSTKLFVTYVEIVQESLSYTPDGMSKWNEFKVLLLERKIKMFKNMAKSLYFSHQASQLCTQKMHMLDHVGEDIRRLGGLRYSDASLYEYAHTTVKTAHRSTSRRKSSAMDETISAYSKDINGGAIDGRADNAHGTVISNRSVNVQKRQPIAQKFAREQDCATLVKSGRNVLLTEIERARRLIRKKRIAHEQNQENLFDELDLALRSVQREARDLVEDIGEVASRVLHRELLTAQSTELCSDIGERTLSLIRVASGYVSGVPTPTSKDYDKQKNTVSINEASQRKCQRFISAKGFYGSPGLRQDCVVLQASEASRTGSIQLWFAKVLALFRAENVSLQGEDQLAFVQFFDATALEDEVEESLGCVRLVWARGDTSATHGVNEYNSSSHTEGRERKWFALLPVSTIRGVVQVLRGDYGIEKRGIEVDMEEVGWELQHFYVNRFHFESDSLDRHVPELT